MKIILKKQQNVANAELRLPQALYAAQRAVVILSGKRDIPAQPPGSLIGLCRFPAGKFDFRENERSQVSVKDVELKGESVLERDHIPCLGDQTSVRFFSEVFIAVSGQRKIIFFPGHESFGLVGEKIAVPVPAHPDHGISAQVTLLDLTEG